VLKPAPGGLAIPQLVEALSWFGIQMDTKSLLLLVRRYVSQVRLRLYRGVVTLPGTAPSFTMRVAEKEPTPSLGHSQAAAQQHFAALVDNNLTNVEVMDLVLSHAPQGLWADEFLAIAKTLGIDFKEWCIHSVVGKEAKGRFGRKNGRLSRVKPPGTFRVTRQELHQVLDGQITVDGQAILSDQVAAGNLMVEILRLFPGGLLLTEWCAAFKLLGGQAQYKRFRAKAYSLAEKGRCTIKNLRAAPLAPTIGIPGSPAV
jgi:hypothetical protein